MSWSAYSDSPPLSSDKARGVFAAGLKGYQAAAMLKPISQPGVRIDEGGYLCAELQMVLHEVALLELAVPDQQESGAP